MEIIAIANQKGGVAKTTSTFNLAYYKAMIGKRVLMVDLDPQASLTISCGFEPGGDNFEGYNVCHLFNQGADPADCVFSVPSTKLDNLYLIPSDIDLAETETFLLTKASREKQLKRALNKLAQYFDYIFIDCPPQLGLLSTNALVAADKVIIPCKTDYLSYRGLRALMGTINNVREDEDLNPNLQTAGIIATFYEKQVNDQQDVLRLLEEKAPVLGIVKKAADVYRNVINGQPVIMAKPKSDVAIAYTAIAKSI